MQFDELDAVRRDRVAEGRLYREFLRVPAMSAGLYELPAGTADPQQPHAEDELYCVVAGRAGFECDGETRPIGPGSVIFM